MPLGAALYNQGVLDAGAFEGIERFKDGIEWVGVQKIVAWTIDTAFSIPAAAALLVVGAFIIYVGTKIADRQSLARLRRRAES